MNNRWGNEKHKGLNPGACPGGGAQGPGPPRN